MGKPSTRRPLISDAAATVTPVYAGEHGVRGAETARLRRVDRADDTAAAEGRDPAQRDRVHREHGTTASLFRARPDVAVTS